MIAAKAATDATQEEAEDALADDADSIGEFLAQFASDAHQFSVWRLEPKTLMVKGQAHNVGGFLKTFYRVPTIDEIANIWGGGLYEIRVAGVIGTGKGSFRIISRKKFEIAGDAKYVDQQPKETPVAVAPPPPPAAESPALMQQILNHTFEDKRRVEERFERERQRMAERTPSQDPTVLQTTLSAIERSQLNQIELLRQQLDRRDQEMAELRLHTEAARTRPSALDEMLRQQLERRDQEMAELRLHTEAARTRPSPLENPEVLKVLFGRNQDDAARLVDQHKSELQMEQARHDREMEAERERHRRDLEQRQREVLAERERFQRELEVERQRQQRDLERHQRELAAEAERRERDVAAEAERHERDVATERRDREQQIGVIERLHRSEVETMRNSQAQLLMTKDEHLARLTDELSRLRAMANPPDALGDLKRVGEVVSAVRNFVPGLSGEEPEPASPWDKMLDRAGPLMERIADNLTKPAPVHFVAPAVPAAPAASPRPQPLASRRSPAPIVVREPRTRSVPDVARRPLRAVLIDPPQPRPSSADSRPPVAAPAQPATPTAAPAAPDAIEGLAFLEEAVKAGKPVDSVSKESVSRFPASYLQALVSAGPELVVNEIEKRSPDSVLVSPGGKRYLRELIDVLRSDLDAAR